MKLFLLFFVLVSFGAEAHSLFCQFKNGPAGSAYPDNVDTITQDLSNGTKAVATRRAGPNNNLIYELVIITNSNEKIASSRTSVPLAFGNGDQNGIVVTLSHFILDDFVVCEFRI